MVAVDSRLERAAELRDYANSRLAPLPGRQAERLRREQAAALAERTDLTRADILQIVALAKGRNTFIAREMAGLLRDVVMNTSP